VEIVYEPIMLQFNEVYPGIKANFDIQPWGGRREKLYTAVAAGAPPDIWYSNTDTLLTYIEKGIVASLDECLTPDLLEDFPQHILDAGSWEGKLYVISNWLFVLGYGYNSELMEAVGYDVSSPSMTWDELLDLGEKAKGEGWYVEDINLMDWSEWVTSLHQAGGKIFNEDKLSTNMTSQPAIDTLSRWVQEYQLDYVPLEGAVASAEESGAIPDYFNERIQLMDSHFWNTSCASIIASEPDFPIASGGPRQKDASAPLISGVSGGAGWSMAQLSEQKPAACEWIKFMTRPDNLGLWCTLTKRTPPGELAQKYWQIDPCVKEFTSRNAAYLVGGLDPQLLWQEGKTICAPHFQAAVLGEATVEEALENCDRELVEILQERYG
jgi:multiple sugar transport system substrate-binding protein